MAAAFALALAHAATVRAQQAPYANYLVGERALGLAGAFVALGDDASAWFHNPAGAAQLSTSAISGSLWALSLRTRDADRGLTTPFDRVGFEHEELASLPLFLGGVAKIGDKDAAGRRKHGLGVSLFRPYRDNYDYASRAMASGGAPARDFNIRHEDDSLWFGLGYAVQLSDALSWGASLFLVRRSIDHEEVELSVAGDSAPLVGRTARADVQGYHTALRVGVMYRHDRKWQFGAMAQLPAIPLSASADLTTLGPQFGDAEGTDPSGFVRRDATVDANLPLPWELRVGATHRPHEATLLTLDVSLTGPAGSVHHPLLKNAPELLMLPTSTRQVASVHAALGFEWVVAKVVPLRGGLVWEAPRTPKLDAASSRYLERRLTTFGAAISVGWRTDGFDFSLGTTALLNQGQALGLVRDSGWADARYERTNTVDRSIFIYLAGGRSAVELVADSVKPILAPD